MSDPMLEILDRPIDDVEPPRTPPMGTWRFGIKSGKLKAGKGENGPMAEALFGCKLLEAYDDVSEVELEEFGNIDSATAYHKIPVFDRSDEWNIKRFLNTAGVDYSEAETLGEAVGLAKGYEFVALLKHKENPNNPDNPYVNLFDVSSVE